MRPKARTRGWFSLCLASCVLAASSVAVAQDASLFSRNTEVPFYYVHGGGRAWPIIDGKLANDTAVRLVARQQDRVLAEGKAIAFQGIRASVSRDGKLIVEAEVEAKPISFELEVRLADHEKAIASQKLSLRVAPPPRPISYVADLVDDIIRIYWDANSGRFRPITSDGFHQYFRRLQAHGVTRLVVWQSPFPYMSDPKEFTAEDWQRYESQARAIAQAEELSEAMQSADGLQTWEFLRELLALRLRPEFGPMFAESAWQHGIRLTASFRPFEHALTKYNEVPTFDAAGNYLWGFLPLASPVVNYHPDQVGFAHYREILARMGNREAAELDAIEVSGVEQATELVHRFRSGQRDLKIVASPFPPLDSSSWVLVRGADQEFRLRRFGEVRDTVEGQLHRVTQYKLASDKPNTLRITNVQVPADCRFLIISSASEFSQSLQFPADADLTLRAKAANRIGRVNIYWALDESTPEGSSTRVAGILADGQSRAEFQATENSIATLIKRKSDKLALENNQLVVGLGRRWEVELVDFNRPAARRYAVAQLRTMLSHEAFDEILINTRTHTDLAGSFGDGVDGIRTVFHYRSAGHRRAGFRIDEDSFVLLGIDGAFAPVGVAEEPQLQRLGDDPKSVERITTSPPGEWQGTCQSANTPFQWRFGGNRAVAQGIRRLLTDIEGAFPDTRIRAVIPQRAAVGEAVERGLAEMKNPNGGLYGSDFYRYIWSTNNFTFRTCEGMAMLDLSGLRVEPVFLGVRYAPDDGPFSLFLDQCIEDMRDNHGSQFHGARTFFYEAQETLRGDNTARFSKRREEIIRQLLSKREDIREVLLYEAADWTYYLPLDDPYGFLDEQRD